MVSAFLLEFQSIAFKRYFKVWKIRENGPEIVSWALIVSEIFQFKTYWNFIVILEEVN